MNFKHLFACLLVLPTMACTQAELSNPQPGTASSSREQIMCTQDARQCPDGSWVGRSGPACEFKCPAAR